jgi:hypothetical protein
MIELRYTGAAGQERTRGLPNAWLALSAAQNLAVEWQMTVYVWDDGIPAATVYDDGRIVITL